MNRRARVTLRVFESALRAWWDDDAFRLGASLAYYTLFAIAPVLLVATAVAGLVFGGEAVRGEIVGQLDSLIGSEGARAVQSLLEGASQRRTGVLATVFGSVTFVVAATGAFLELQTALNTIWRVKPKPGIHLRAFLLDRVRSFGLVVAIGFLLMVSLAMTAAVAALNGWLARYATSGPLLWNGVSMFVSLIVTTGLFALLLRSLPDVRLRWPDVMIGGLVTAVLFTLGQQLIGLYLGQSSMASSYGAAGSVMILLLWVYYSCQILLLGAEFTRAYAQRGGAEAPPESFAESTLPPGPRLGDPNAVRIRDHVSRCDHRQNEDQGQQPFVAAGLQQRTGAWAADVPDAAGRDTPLGEHRHTVFEAGHR